MPKPTRIVRAEHESDYFISTRHAPQDRELSWEARGILWYLLSKPNDWEVQPKDLEQGCGHSKVYKLLKELRDARYIKLIAERDEKKRITGYVYEVHETPYDESPEGDDYTQAKPVAKKQQPEKQQAEIQRAEIQHLTKEENIENTESASAPNGAVDSPTPPAKPDKPVTPFSATKSKIVELFRYNADRRTPTKSEWGMVQAAAKQLCDAGYTLDQVERIYRYCKGHFEMFTPMALPKNASNAMQSAELQSPRLLDTKKNMGHLDGILAQTKEREAHLAIVEKASS